MKKKKVENKYLNLLKESVEDFEKGKTTYKGLEDDVVSARLTPGSHLKTHENKNNVVSILERFYFEEDELDEYSSLTEDIDSMQSDGGNKETGAEGDMNAIDAEDSPMSESPNDAGLKSIFEMDEEITEDSPMDEGTHGIATSGRDFNKDEDVIKEQETEEAVFTEMEGEEDEDELNSEPEAPMAPAKEEPASETLDLDAAVEETPPAPALEAPAEEEEEVDESSLFEMDEAEEEGKESVGAGESRPGHETDEDTEQATPEADAQGTEESVFTEMEEEMEAPEPEEEGSAEATPAKIEATGDPTLIARGQTEEKVVERLIREMETASEETTKLDEDLDIEENTELNLTEDFYSY